MRKEISPVLRRQWQQKAEVRQAEPNTHIRELKETRELIFSCREPITRSVQLPYSVCETAFSQVGLFLDQNLPGISLRFFRSDLFISFGFS